MKKRMYALAMLIGTAVGVGMFGLPYVTAQFGFFPTLVIFGLLAVVNIIYQLIYGEICLRTVESHRLPGYAEKYLGAKAKRVLVVTNIISLYGALLAYIVVGGQFFADLLTPWLGGPVIAYILIYFAVASFIIYFGRTFIAQSEIFSLSVFTAAILFLFYMAGPYIALDNFLTFNLKNIIFPYGVILFALSAQSIIPEIRETLSGQEPSFKKIIYAGTIMPSIIYILFIILVLGVTGQATTPDALTGLGQTLGQKIIIAAFIFGVLTPFTSYLTVGLTLKKIYIYDLQFNHFTAWIMATFVPLLFYFVGIQNFIKIISFSAAATAMIEGVLTYLIYLKAKTTGNRRPEFNLPFNKLMLYPLGSLFVLGFIATIFALIK